MLRTTGMRVISRPTAVPPLAEHVGDEQAGAQMTMAHQDHTQSGIWQRLARAPAPAPWPRGRQHPRRCHPDAQQPQQHPHRHAHGSHTSRPVMKYCFRRDIMACRTLTSGARRGSHLHPGAAGLAAGGDAGAGAGAAASGASGRGAGSAPWRRHRGNRSRTSPDPELKTGGGEAVYRNAACPPGRAPLSSDRTFSAARPWQSRRRRTCR